MSGLTPALQNSPLGKLSPELRNRIFQYALTQPDTIQINSGIYRKDPSAMKLTVSGGDSHMLALTTTCKQIRAETVQVFFAVNHFAIAVERAAISWYHNWIKRIRGALECFLHKIGAPNEKALRHVLVELPTFDNWHRFHGRRALSLLEASRAFFGIAHGLATRNKQLNLTITAKVSFSTAVGQHHTHVIRVQMRTAVSDLRGALHGIQKCESCRDTMSPGWAIVHIIGHWMRFCEG